MACFAAAKPIPPEPDLPSYTPHHCLATHHSFLTQPGSTLCLALPAPVSYAGTYEAALTSPPGGLQHVPDNLCRVSRCPAFPRYVWVFLPRLGGGGRKTPVPIWDLAGPWPPFFFFVCYSVPLWAFSRASNRGFHVPCSTCCPSTAFTGDPSASFGERMKLGGGTQQCSLVGEAVLLKGSLRLFSPPSNWCRDALDSLASLARLHCHTPP